MRHSPVSGKDVLFAVLIVAASFLATAAQSRVENFGLKDQGDKYVEVNFPSDRPVVLIFGDRKGSKQIEGWSAPIFRKFDGKIYMFGIASLGGVPSYARGLVRRLIKRQTQFPVLLDWGGKVAANFGYEKDKALVVLIGKNGTVLMKETGAASDIELGKIFSEIEKLL